jgi:hypothetical protein
LIRGLTGDSCRVVAGRALVLESAEQVRAAVREFTQ